MLPAHLMRLEELPLTPNGKMDYRALPEPEQEERRVDEPVTPRNKRERLLVEIWQQVFGIEQIGVKESFMALGGESIKAIQINAQLATHQYTLPIGDFFRFPTIAELAPRLQRKEQEAVPITREEIPLTAIQRMALQLRQPHDIWSIEVLWPRPEGWDAATVQSVFTALLQHHDALRICFEKQGQQVVQRYRQVEEVPLAIDEYDLHQEVHPRQQMAVIAERLHQSLNWLEGDLFRLAIFHTAGGDWLLLLIDHLIFDNLSQHILKEDLHVGYQQALQQQTLRFPSKTTSYQEWSEALQSYAHSDQLLSEQPYWQRLYEVPVVSLPYDWPDKQSNRRFRDLHSIQFSLLSDQARRLLTEGYETMTANSHDLLLAAFLRAIGDWTGGSQVAIELFSHGREAINPQVDLSRTIGWFTSLYPVIFDLRQDSLQDAIAEVQMRLEQVPQKGMGYLPLKYLSPASSTAWQKQPLADISFNYLGQVQVTQLSNPELFQIEWPHSLHLVAYLLPDQSLVVHLHYNRHLYRRQTIEKLSQRMQEYLLEGWVKWGKSE
jgi:non-ribosomal peptide synthase protein (TIGR01720 family)